MNQSNCINQSNLFGSRSFPSEFSCCLPAVSRLLLLLFAIALTPLHRSSLILRVISHLGCFCISLKIQAKKMSSSRGALFGSGGGGRQSKNLVEFRAGKMTQKGKMVHPDKRKGLLYVYQADDSLIHLCWKDRQSGTVEDVSYY
jgi:Proteasome complex subunit Rpn13 ubiquitin receptor